MNKLAEIQQSLKAPKGQLNSFGGYKYRSCEDILEAVKPLLGEATLVISDELVNLGDRYYVKATTTLKTDKEEYSTTAYAREPESKKGMDESQITGASSSYARKYALNGLFAIDDTKDADTMDNTQKDEIGTPSNANDDLKADCAVHNVPMKMATSKNGNDYWFHRDANGMCFGKGYK